MASFCVDVMKHNCLYFHSRRWKREQAKAEVMSVASMAGYLNKTGSIGYRMAGPGPASIHQGQEDRFRWSAHLDSLPNIYVQPDSSREYLRVIFSIPEFWNKNLYIQILNRFRS